MSSKFKQRVVVGTDEDGKDIIKWACGNTQKEFQQAFISILEENGLVKASEEHTQPRGKTFDAYAEEWFEVFKKPVLKQKTLTSRECFFKRHILGAFGNKLIGDIRTADVQRVLNGMSNYSMSYVRDIKNYFHSIFEFAVADGYITRNPIDKRVFNPSRKVNKRKALTNSEKADIIANIPRLKKDGDRRFMAFLMFTGMRPGEIYALRWEDIDAESGLIHVRRGSSFDKGEIIIGDTKTAAGVRDIPLDKRLLKHLEPLGREGYIMSREGKHAGEPYTEQAHKRAWERIKRTINVHGMVPYEGRHTYLTELSDAGIELRTVQQIAGHADERMLMRIYVHTRPERVQAAGKAMSDYFDRITGGCEPKCDAFSGCI